MIRPLLLALSKGGRLAFLPIALFLFSLPVLLQGFSFLGQALGLLLQALRVRLFALLVFVVADRVHLGNRLPRINPIAGKLASCLRAILRALSRGQSYLCIQASPCAYAHAGIVLMYIHARIIHACI